MTYGTLIGTLIGVAVTALIYQRFVLPGLSHAQQRPAEAAAPSRAASPPADPAAGPTGPDALAVQIRQREEEIERLQAQVHALRAAGTEAERRLETTEGKAQGWPAGLPPGYRPEALEANLHKLLERTQLGSLSDIDCDEFPCIAVIEAKQQDADWSQRLQDAVLEMTRGGQMGQRVATSIWNSQRQEGDHVVQLSAVALAPPESFDEEMRRRASYRAQAALSSLLPGRRR